MSIELHTWNTPNGRKISVAFEEMGLPYTVKTVNISKGEQFAPAFVKISPNSKIPAIVDPEGPGGQPISIFESGAILIYLGAKTGKFWPADLRRLRLLPLQDARQALQSMPLQTGEFSRPSFRRCPEWRPILPASYRQVFRSS